MATALEYLIYAAAFVAVVLAIEGVGRVLRGFLGEERKIDRRLATLRTRATGSASNEATPEDPISRTLKARFPRLKAALANADARFSALQLLVGAIAIYLTVVVLMSMAGAPSLIANGLAAALALGAPFLVLDIMSNLRRKRFLNQFPQAVDLIARSLQAGHPVTTAMATVGQRMASPLGPEFRLVVEEMTYGLDREEALKNLIRRFPLSEVRMFVACLEVTRESGGNLAEVFLKLAEAIRAKDQLRRKIEAISAEGKMSFWVVSGLPFVVGVALFLLRPTFFTDVASDRLFWPMMAYAPVSLAIGAAMIWRMVNLKI